MNPYRYIVYGIAVLALVAAIVFGVTRCKKQDNEQTNQSINLGAKAERADQQAEALNHVQAAQDAVRNPSDAERNSVCSRYDRNCQSGK